MGCSRCGCCTLDISLPNLNLVNYSERTSNNVVKSCFSPRKGATITCLRDFKCLICQLKRRVDDVTLFHKDDKPYLLSVDMKKGKSKYFIKTDDRWTEIRYRVYEKYESCLEMLAKPEKHIAIDVNPKPSKFWEISTINCGDKKQYMFHPTLGYYARAVVDGDTTIWKPENDAERCFDVEVYYNKNEKEFVSVCISDMGDIKEKYYQCVNGKWEETDEHTINNIY